MKSNANGIAGSIADLKAATDGFDNHSPGTNDTIEKRMEHHGHWRLLWPEKAADKRGRCRFCCNEVVRLCSAGVKPYFHIQEATYIGIG